MFNRLIFCCGMFAIFSYSLETSFFIYILQIVHALSTDVGFPIFILKSILRANTFYLERNLETQAFVCTLSHFSLSPQILMVALSLSLYYDVQYIVHRSFVSSLSLHFRKSKLKATVLLTVLLTKYQRVNMFLCNYFVQHF